MAWVQSSVPHPPKTRTLCPNLSVLPGSSFRGTWEWERIRHSGASSWALFSGGGQGGKPLEEIKALFFQMLRKGATWNGFCFFQQNIEVLKLSPFKDWLTAQHGLRLFLPLSSLKFVWCQRIHHGQKTRAYCCFSLLSLSWSVMGDSSISWPHL